MKTLPTLMGGGGGVNDIDIVNTSHYTRGHLRLDNQRAQISPTC